MNFKKLVFVFFFAVSSSVYSQKSTVSVEEKMSQILQLIESGDINSLMQESSKNMYCLLCYPENGHKKSNYKIDKKTFFKTHYALIFDKELLKRLQRGEKTIVADKTKDSDYLVLYTTYKPNEFAEGHEGAQFAFWFKEENGLLKWSGVETIP